MRTHGSEIGGAGGGARRVLLFMAMAVSLAGCQSLDTTGAPFGGMVETPATEAPTDLVRVLTEEAAALARAGELDRASGLMNTALKLDITNPDLQYLNALIYHLMAEAGDRSRYRLAEQGYLIALRHDPAHVPARHGLGQLYLDQRRFRLAQGYLASAALHRHDDPDLLFDLAAASYYAHDPRYADAALNRIEAVAPDTAATPAFLQARAIVAAALNDARAAARALDAYREAAPDGAPHLERRVTSWRAFYEHEAQPLLAQGSPFGPPGDSSPFGPAPDGGGPFGPFGPPGETVEPTPAPPPGGLPGGPGGFGGTAPGAFVDSNMVVVDVVLIGTQEDTRESYGVNLLDGLRLQFGDPLLNTPALGRTDNEVQDFRGDEILAQNTQTIVRSISIPAVSYSLNIANALDAGAEILAKPSLIAHSGQTSEFFSGTEVLAAAVSGGQGDSVSVQREVGVKLAVTPEFLPDDLVRLTVNAERTFLTDPSSSVVFEFRLDTTKTNINATVTMRFGETLILGGLAERETSSSNSGVPIIRDIPGLNLFFAERSERRFERSVLILLTPRRPQFARQSDQDLARTLESLSELERDLERLETRHQEWFTPRPIFNEVFDNLNGTAFFREFQSGDLPVEGLAPDSRLTEMLDATKRRLFGV